MANNGSITISDPGAAAPPQVSPAPLQEPVALARRWALENASVVRIIDPAAAHDYIRRRQELGLDRLDEVWDGVYVVAPLATNQHQDVIAGLAALFFRGINLEARGRVLPGANVSDRREGWESNYRIPDTVVVLNGGRAVDCGTHWMGGPDFLVEVRSPGDETEAKFPFYSGIGVRELLVVHRDTRELRLYRHDGQQLTEVPPSEHQGGRWLVSQVIPFAFRREVTGSGPRTQVLRTDETPGCWTI
ncbi:MAG TPA: Uma2 family endonuclease [Gemmataceae bacterium]|nr:Uma2 family endonuclease [Gemmataceae bacterium]